MWVRGVITVDAPNDQAARATAFAKYWDDGIDWRMVEEDERYNVRIVEVEPV